MEPRDSGHPGLCLAVPKAERIYVHQLGSPAIGTHTLVIMEEGMSEYVDRTKGPWGDSEQVEPGPHFTSLSPPLPEP